MEENKKDWCKYLPLLGLLLLGLLGYLMNYAGKNNAKKLAMDAKNTAQEALDLNKFTFAAATLDGAKIVLKGDAKDKATKEAACSSVVKALQAKKMLGIPGLVHSVSCELLPADEVKLAGEGAKLPNVTPAPPASPASVNTNANGATDAKTCQDELNSIAASGQVGFAKGGVIVTSGMEMLDKIAVAAKKCAAHKIEIGGHTDSGGDDAMNMRLSQLRAQQVRAYLIQKGASSTQLSAKGYGETKPLVQDNAVIGIDNPERAKNRRTEFTILAQ